MNFKPIGEWLSIRFRPPVTKTKSGLFLPKPQYSQIATVIAVGEKVEDLKAGDVVIVHKHGDAMNTQQSLWYHYFNQVSKNPDQKFEVAPIIIDQSDIFGKWDDKKGLMPHRNNVVFIEYEEPEKINGVYRIQRHRQNRKPIGEIIRVAAGVKGFKKGTKVLLGKYGGVYFTDIDGKEKVLVATNEILGTLTNVNRKTRIKIGEPLELHDPKAGSEFFNQ